jgi:hypothetical protein
VNIVPPVLPLAMNNPATTMKLARTHSLFKSNACVPGVKMVRDVPYSAAARQKIEVYIPPNAHKLP